MTPRLRTGILVALACLPPSAAVGQVPKEWKTAMAGTRAAPKPSGTPTFGATEPQPYLKTGMSWTIACEAPVSCAHMLPRLFQEGSAPGKVDTLAVLPVPDSPATEREAKYLVFGTKPTGTLVLVMDTTNTQSPVFRATVVQEGSANVAATTISIDASCRNSVPLRPETGSGSAFVPHFVVDFLGNVYLRPEWPIDDRDRVRVTVIAKQDALAQLRISRHSAFRSVGTLNILGSDIDASKLIPHSDRGPVQLGCRTVTLGDFASGKGEVEIAFIDDKGAAQVVGNFDFAVNPTYTGALSLGAIRTPLLDPDIGLAFNGTDTVITVKSDGIQGEDKEAHRILYTVAYTYYMWGRRDIEKPRPFLQRINPMMGVVLNDIPNNFIAGATVDLFDGVFLHAGAHAGKVRTLDPHSGLEIGDEYTGKETEVPIVRRWRTKFFVGVSVDLRAAVQLFTAAVGSVAK